MGADDTEQVTTSGHADSRPKSPATYVLRASAPNGIFAVPLPSTGVTCVGRGQDADLRVPMLEMSRQHFRLRWEDGALSIADVGSSNGTVLRGERLPVNVWKPLALRELFFVGNAALVVHEGSITDAPKRVVGFDAFEALVEAHLRAYATHAQAKQPFGVCAIDMDHESAWSDFVVALLSRHDAVGYVSESKMRVLLVDRPVAQLDGILDFLNRSLLTLSVSRRVTMRACPRDGETVAALDYDARERTRDVAAHETRRPSSPVIRSVAMQKVYAIVDDVARTPTTILILGETGVGKDVLARAIHQRSERFAAPLVGLNCAALPESLLESELFGYERGAFTGAVAAKQGLIESAEGGTVFLDEVGEMPLSTQAKLLRVLEDRKVLRLGGLKPKAVNFRLLAATNRNLHAEIAAGRFRADLFYRINGLAISIPPLRDRRDEIMSLALHFAERAAATLRRPMPLFAAETHACLERYPWPGNIRELRSVVERAVLLSRGHPILAEHLPDEILAQASSRFPSSLETPTSVKLPRLADEDDELDVESTRTVLVRSAIPPPPPSRELGDRAPLSASLPDEIERIEHERIVKALRDNAGNQTRAAAALGITRRVLIGRLERYGLPRPRKGKDE